MAKSSTPLPRLLHLLTLVQSQPGWNAKRLAAKFKTSERNIYRDLQTLQTAGVPLSYDRDTSGYRVRGDFFLPPVQLTVEEALSLTMLAEQIGQHEQVPFTRAAIRAIEKVRGHLPDVIQDELDTVTPHIAIKLAAAEHNDMPRDVYEVVRHAIANRRALQCTYESAGSHSDDATSSNGNSSDQPFLFRPFCLFFCQRAWYTIGWHERHDALRCLRLCRFARCEPTPKPYAIPDDFTLRSYLGKAWRMRRSGTIHQVEIHFDADRADTVSETHWHETQEYDRHEDGSITFRCEVDGLDEIVWWILGYGPHCRVIKPKALRDRVADLHRASASKYGKSGKYTDAMSSEG